MPLITETQARSGISQKAASPIIPEAPTAPTEQGQPPPRPEVGQPPTLNFSSPPTLLNIQDDPSFIDVFAAAFRQENTIGAAIEAARAARSGEIDPNYDPFQDIEGYEPWAQSFIKASSPEDVQAIKVKIDRELKDRETIANGGITGILAVIASGVIDPIMFIPVGGQAAKVVRGAGTANNVLRGASRTAMAGFVGSAVSEAVLHPLQETRTMGESVFNVAGATFLSGILGGAAGAYSSFRFNQIVRAIEKEMEVPPTRGRSQLPKVYQDIKTEPASLKIADDVIEADTKLLDPDATTQTELQLKSALGLEKLVGAKNRWARFITTPIMRTATSIAKATRKAVFELADTPFFTEGNALGIASPFSVESRSKLWTGNLVKALEGMDSIFTRFMQNKGVGRLRAFSERQLDFGEYRTFRREVGKALRNGDKHAIPEVAEAARLFRKTVFEPLKERAVKAGLLPEDVKPETAMSYFTRVYNIDKIITERAKFKGIVIDYLRGRKVKGEKIAEDMLDEAADDIIDQIIRTPDGRVPYSVTISSRGPLAKRTFKIKDELIKDFLESDVEIVSRYFVRTMAPDVEIAMKFGSPDMKETIRAIRKEYRQKIEKAPTEKLREKLQARMEDDIRDVAGMRDRLRGTFAAGHSAGDPNSIPVRLSSVIRNLNYLALLGQVTISSIPDLARSVMVHGVMKSFKHGLVPMVTNFRTFRMATKELRAFAVGVDMVMNSRAQSLFDIGDTFGRRTFIERGVRKATNTFNLINLMSPWNAAMKQFSGVVTQARILDAVDAAKVGKASKKEISNLAKSGIDGDMATRIANQFSEFGTSRGGVRLSNTPNWTDIDARDVFRAAVLKEVDTIIVTPGIGDTPLWTSTTMGRTIAQFKSFTWAATQRMAIAGLQQRDMAAMNGLILSIGLGALSYGIKEQLAGRVLPDNPAEWVVRGIERSGVTGWLYDSGEILNRGTRGTFMPDYADGGPVKSRFLADNLIMSLLGPSVSTADNAVDVFGALASRDVRASDVRAARRLVPYQNLFYIRGVFDKMEAGINESLGNRP